MVPELGVSVGDLLLAPHRGYFRQLEGLLDRRLLKGMAHITGGGITENVPRILPPGTAAEVHKGTWPVLPVFDYLQKMGNIEDAEMFRTFNMGVGMILVVSPEDVPEVKTYLDSRAESCFDIGVIVEGNREVCYR